MGTSDANATGNHRPWLISIAASAGGIPALKILLQGLPADLNAAVVIVQHRRADGSSVLEQILGRVARMPVAEAKSGDRIRAGHIYLARPDLHLVVRPDGRFGYVDGRRVRGLLSAGNPLFDSAGRVFRDRAMAVVLTGSGTDATDGVQAVKAGGGIVVAQDPLTAAHRGMPRSAVNTGVVDHVLPIEAIGPALVAITRGEPVQGALAG